MTELRAWAEALTPDEQERIRLAALPWSELDESDPNVATVVRVARREARDPLAAPSEKLVQACAELASDHLDHARRVVMVRHPDVRAGASGSGGIWAVVSRLVNEAAELAATEHVHR